MYIKLKTQLDGCRSLLPWSFLTGLTFNGIHTPQSEKNLQVRNTRNGNTSVLPHIPLGWERSHSSPPALSATTYSKATLPCSDDLLVGFLTEPSGWEVLREFTSQVTFLRKLLQNVLH